MNLLPAAFSVPTSLSFGVTSPFSFWQKRSATVSFSPPSRWGLGRCVYWCALWGSLEIQPSEQPQPSGRQTAVKDSSAVQQISRSPSQEPFHPPPWLMSGKTIIRGKFAGVPWAWSFVVLPWRSAPMKLVLGVELGRGE